MTTTIMALNPDEVRLIQRHREHKEYSRLASFKRNIPLESNATALNELIAKAGEVMRERCADKCTDPYYTPDGYGITGADRRCADEIRTLPGVKLEDLK